MEGDAEALVARTEVPGTTVELTGRALKRRLNWLISGNVVILLLVMGCLAGVIYSDATLRTVHVVVQSARREMSALARMAQMVDAQGVSTLFACPSAEANREAFPERWIVLGSADLMLPSRDIPSGHAWYELLGRRAPDDVIAPALEEPATAESLLAQLAWLEEQSNGTRFDSWVRSRQPIAVFVSYGYRELLVRARPIEVLGQLQRLFGVGWLNFWRNRLVVITRGPSFTPAGLLLSPEVHACTDQLAYSLYNDPADPLVPKRVQAAADMVTQAFAALALSGTSNARTHIVTLDSVVGREHAWGAPVPASEVAYADDCWALSQRGHALLASSLASCLAVETRQ